MNFLQWEKEGILGGFLPDMETLITIQIDWQGDRWNSIKKDQTIRQTILDPQIEGISEDQKEDQLMEEEVL